VTRRHGDSDVWQFDTSPCHRAVISALPAFREAAEALGITMAADELLARHTTFHIGGPADLYATANDIAQLERLAELATAHDIPTTILGGGSNILVSDTGVHGLVIANHTRQIGIQDVRPVPGTAGHAMPGTAGHAMGCTEDVNSLPALRASGLLQADSGVALVGLARWAIKNGWTGLEWAVSVPGTVGGAVIGNAGAHGSDIASNLTWALVAYPRQGKKQLAAAELEFAYRSSLLKRQIAAGRAAPVVLAAGFQLQRGNITEMTARADGYLARRRASQPVEPSAGSIFRNPPGDYAGRMIETVGLKGHRIGGAQISPRHANFIVNVAHAKAADVLALIDLMRERVNEQFGVELLPEILFLGDWLVQPPYRALQL
jgi:UDP-N-acetylmuramate dehydrogenase